MISTKLGKYQIIKWLGGGAFGDVYLVKDSVLGEEFALKVSRLSPKEVRLLQEEARLLARLYHPNIVRFYNADFIDGRLVMVMEYIEGGSLRELVEERGVDVLRAVEITVEVLEALKYAHAQGVLHRDIKPENILLTSDGKVKVTDFGLARFLKEGTISASMAGTPVYLPPEGWKGEFSEESDIYSVGVVLYEMLTGVQPFTGNSLEEVRKKIFDGDVRPPDFYNSDVSRELAEICMKAIARDRKDRYASAEEFMHALQRFLSPSSRVRKAVDIQLAGEGGLKLTEAQKKVVETDAKKILLLGGAGTGKTTCLIYRVCFLIREKNLEPSRALVVAFTRKAANDVRDRIEHIMHRDVGEILIDTVHGLALRILRKYGWMMNIPEDFEVIPPSDEYLGYFDLKNESRRTLKRLIREVEKLKARLVSPDKIDGWAGDNQFRKKVRDVFVKTLELAAAGILTYEDLLYFTCRLLMENPDVQKELTENFDAVFADEIQDFSWSQYSLLKMLVKNDAYLFITGDPNQNIYSWRGASPVYISQAKKDFPDMQTFTLSTSFRLPRKIMHAAHNLMSRTQAQIMVGATASREEGEIELYRASSEKDEANFVVRRIKELIQEEGCTYSDVAVLFRAHFMSRLIEEALMKAEIPYALVGLTAFYEREEVVRCVEALRAIIRKDEKELVKFLAWVTGSRVMVQRFKEEKSLEKLKEKMSARYLRVLDYVLQLLKTPDQVMPGDVLKVFLVDTGFLEKLRKKKSGSLLGTAENLEELIRAAQDFRGTIRDFIHHVGLMEDLELARWNTNTVKVMTVHSAKGLEFPYVFIMGLADGIFPLEGSTVNQKDLAEERRLFYVALTRAQKKVILSFPARRNWQTLRPSRFLMDIVLK